MSFKFSTGFRNAVLVTGSAKAALDGGLVKIYAGTAPVTADDSLGAATLLCTISDNGAGGGLTFDAAASDGVMQKTAAQTWKGTNVASGVAAFFRYVGAADDGTLSTTQARIQGTVAIAGGDMNLASTTLTATLEQVIDYFALAFPTA